MIGVKHLIKRSIACMLLSLSSILGSALTQAQETVDVMVLYTSQVKSQQSSISAYINHLVSATNTAYETSQMNIRLRLVHTQEVNISGAQSVTSSGLDVLRRNSSVKALRSQYGADVVTLLASPTSSACGIGYVGSGRNGQFSSSADDYAYNITGGGSSCSSMTFAHEVGHNIGLGHSRKQGSSGGVFGYGVGYGVDNQFSTIMGYPSAFSTRTRLKRFSDPSTRECQGYPCGVDAQASNGSDAVRAVNNVARQIASWYPTEVGDGGGGGGCSIPNAPNRPTASNIGSSSYTISWNAVSGAESYQVQSWRNRAWQNYAVVRTPQANISGESGNVAYSRVIAINSCGSQGTPSSYVSVTLDSNGGGCTAPSRPNTPSASNVGQTSYTLSWSAVNGASSYVVQRWNRSQGAWENYQTTDSTSIRVSGESGDTAYARIFAVSGCGEASSASSYVTVDLIPDDSGGAGNLVQNGDFESGSLSSWRVGFNGRIGVSNESYEGNFGLSAFDRSQWYDGPVQDLTGRINENTTYNVSAWSKMSRGSDTIQARILYRDAAGYHWVSVIRSAIGSDWSQVNADFNLNSVQGELQEARLYFFGPQPGEVFYVDNIELVER